MATKTAEVSVLRSRLQQFERENVRLQNQLSAVKDNAEQNERYRQQKSEIERLENELRYVKADLVTSADERRRLQSTLKVAETSLESLRHQPLEAPAAACAAAVAGPAPVQQLLVRPPSPQPAPQSVPTGQTGGIRNPSQPGEVQGFTRCIAPPCSPSDRVQESAGDVQPFRRAGLPLREVLCCEASAWEAAMRTVPTLESTSMAPWVTLRELIGCSAEAAESQSRSGYRYNLHTDTSRGSTATASSTTRDIGIAITQQLQAALRLQHWLGVQSGARFVEVWAGLLPRHVADLAAACSSINDSQDGAAPCSYMEVDAAQDASLFFTLSDALHKVVLEKRHPCQQHEFAGDDQRRCDCCKQLLVTFTELAARLGPSGLEALAPLLLRPSLCALLNVEPQVGSLHLPCLQLLQLLLQSPMLFHLAHRAHSDQNALLTAANLLVAPAIQGARTTSAATTSAGAAETAAAMDVDGTAQMPASGVEPEGQDDSAERQLCREAALELFCRCLATVPRPDAVLNLRGCPTVGDEVVDTVLQRIVLLCHHELLCLSLHGDAGGPWRDAELLACAGRRSRCAERGLGVLAHFVWQVAPWSPDLPQAESDGAQDAACEALGRTRPLLSSIVDLAAARGTALGAGSGGRFLAAASALRVLLAKVDGSPSP